MVSRQARSRLRKELAAIHADPPPHIHVYCDEENIISWSYLLEGPPDTPYEGGWYWGRLKLPKTYPFAPPSIIMLTPNGRFETNTRLCLSMSDYHPESWEPAWSLATVLQGLLSFMCEETPTTGGIDPPPSESQRRKLAAASLAWNQTQPEFARAFPQVDEIVTKARALRPLSSAAAAHVKPVTSPPPSVGPARFAVGDIVRLHGLTVRTDINGHEAVVVAPDESTVEKGRVQVLVDGTSLAIKPENMEWISGA